MGDHVIDAVQHLNVSDSIQVTELFFKKEEETSSFVSLGLEIYNNITNNIL